MIIFWGKSIKITIYVLKKGHVGKPTKQIPEIKIPDIAANSSVFFGRFYELYTDISDYNPDFDHGTSRNAQK